MNQGESFKKMTSLNDMFKYKGGYPTKETVELLYDQLDLQRAIQAYLHFMPAMSMQAVLNVLKQDYNLSGPRHLAVYTEPGTGKSEAIGLTYNTESVYAHSTIDLKMDGPTVIEIPENVLGVVNDGHMRYVTDLGNVGPDKGQGGKYLIILDNYEGEVPEGYFVFRSPTYRNWVMMRGFPQSTGTGDKALAYYQEHLRLYPLSGKPQEEEKKAISMSFTKHNATHPRDITYFELLNRMVQYEPATAFSAYELGLLKSFGIEKGKEYSPDARMTKILENAVKMGDGMAKAIAFSHRDPAAKIYSDRHWEAIFVGGSHEFIKDGALLLDARTLFHYTAIVITPAMTRKMVGAGSQYLGTYKDAAGEYLDGGKNYKLTLPTGIPAKNFWSVTVYDADTRSLLQNGEPKPSISSYDNPSVDEDGSITIYFGPVTPKESEQNWIKTLPDKGWFTYLRLYGPLEPFFAKIWKPNDIILV